MEKTLKANNTLLQGLQPFNAFFLFFFCVSKLQGLCNVSKWVNVSFFFVTIITSKQHKKTIEKVQTAEKGSKIQNNTHTKKNIRNTSTDTHNKNKTYP